MDMNFLPQGLVSLLINIINSIKLVFEYLGIDKYLMDIDIKRILMILGILYVISIVRKIVKSGFSIIISIVVVYLIMRFTNY